VKNHKAAGYVIKEFRLETVVPETVKYILAGELLKEKVRLFIGRLQEWQSLCNEMKLEHKMRQDEDPLVQLPELKYPAAPRFSVNLSEAEIQELQRTAEKKRTRWERMAKEGKQGKGRQLLSV
jgi:hypothetical protein